MERHQLIDYPSIDFQLYITKGKHIDDVPLHTHDCTELTIVTGGSATHLIEDKEYTIKKGDVLVVIPDFSHANTNVDGLEHYNFLFDLNKLLIMDKELKSLAGFETFFITKPYYRYHHHFVSTMVLTEEQFSFVKTLCDLMYNEFTQKKGGYKVTVKAYFLTLIAYISSTYMPEQDSDTLRFQQIIQTANYIEENYDKKISVPELAQMAYLSVRQYTRIFTQVIGLPPIEYLIDCRLNNACFLIKNSSKTITEIAETCGFTDKSAFSRMFRKKLKISPSEYRSL